MHDLRQLFPAPLAAQAARLRRLTAILYRKLPQNLAAHCEVIGFSDGILTLAVDSPAWQTRLRFVESEIRRNWPDSEGEIRKIRLRVVDIPIDAVPQRSTPPVPDSAAEQMRQVAQYIQHPGLAGALRRLAKRQRGPR